MRVFSIILLIMVGAVFAAGPAGLLKVLFEGRGFGADSLLTSALFWMIVILVYYFIATFVSIDKIIGKIYPLFGICLLIMAFGVCWGVLTGDKPMPLCKGCFNGDYPVPPPVRMNKLSFEIPLSRAKEENA